MSFLPDQTTLVTAPIVGMEAVQRACFYVLFEGVNNAIDELSDYWTAFDLEFDTVTGRSLSPTVVEHVDPANFHEGHKPSLLTQNPLSYPSIAVMVANASPSEESNRFDTVDSWSDLVMIESMVKGTEEDETNRRIQRLSEAIVMSIRRNPTLGGAVFGIELTPFISISDLFRFQSPTQGGAYPGQAPNGADFLWMGSQIIFRVRKDAVYPSSGPGTFAEASQVEYSANIDQG